MHDGANAMKPIALKSVMPVRAAEEIRGAILSGALLPGTRIKQEELAARLGVSREPVRQALLLLQREGLVSTDPGRTAAVTSPDRRFIADVYEFREVIDGLVAATVAKLAAPDLTRFDEIVARGREAVRIDRSWILDPDWRGSTGVLRRRSLRGKRTGDAARLSTHADRDRDRTFQARAGDGQGLERSVLERAPAGGNLGRPRRNG